MRHWTTGVTVLTARDGAQAHGMTVNSFTSVSLKPPLVLVSLERNTRTYGLVDHTRTFAISILGEHQAELSDHFAGRNSETTNRLDGLPTFTAITGAPILRDNIGYLDCVVVAAYPAGTHTVFVAEVVAAQSANDATPLIYFDRGYHSLAA